MNKSIISIRIILAIFVTVIGSNLCNAQFIQGYGITIGGTYGTQRWNYKEVSQTETKFFHLGMNASAFLEMGDYYNIRWISELQYNRKGARDEFPYFVMKNNEITYISFNNYAKFRKEYDNTTAYAIVGGRLEYKLSTIAGGFVDSPRVSIANFTSIHACISGGVGYEFFIHSVVSPFVEVQYFTDLPIPFFESYTVPAYQNLHIRAKGIEARIGFKFNFHSSGSDKCPPVYL
ncbi:MAG: hypothetical protein WCL14_11145 [Bacteroidota bacterium]